MMRGALAAMGFGCALLRAGAAFAIDSYRYLHVSIETPWTIFLFLLVAVFAPAILMIVLMWWRPLKKSTSAPKSKNPTDE